MTTPIHDGAPTVEDEAAASGEVFERVLRLEERRMRLVGEEVPPLVPEHIFSADSISQRPLFRKAIKASDAYHVTFAPLTDFQPFDISALTEGSGPVQAWYGGLPDEEKDRLQDVHRLKQPCLMSHCMLEEHGYDFGRHPKPAHDKYDLPNTECYFSTDANGILRKFIRGASPEQLKMGIHLLRLDKKEVKESDAHQVGMYKDGPGMEGRGTAGGFEHWGAAASPIPVKDAYLVLDADGPEPQFVCYFKDGKVLDDVSAVPVNARRKLWSAVVLPINARRKLLLAPVNARRKLWSAVVLPINARRKLLLAPINVRRKLLLLASVKEGRKR
ncbi:hypothetical protein ACHAXT_013365 [Thalassiosira profunda]